LISGAAAQITRFSAPAAFSASVADGLIIDIRSGFEAWKDMGLPIEPCRHGLGSVDMLPGAGPPE
jgi:hypothetical protein